MNTTCNLSNTFIKDVVSGVLLLLSLEGWEKFNSWPGQQKLGGGRGGEDLGKCSLCPLFPFPSSLLLILQFPSMLPQLFSPSQPFLQSFALMLQLGMGKTPALGLIHPGETLDKIGNLPMCSAFPQFKHGFFNLIKNDTRSLTPFPPRDI